MKEIRVQVDDGTFDDIQAQAEAAGMEVSAFAGQVLTEAEQKRRFLEAAQRFTSHFTPAFTEAFGYPQTDGGAAAA